MRNQRGLAHGSAAFRDGMVQREAALGLADDSPEQRQQRALKAMEQAWWNFEMAERRQQPWRVMDQMEARYFTALGAYEREMGAA